MAGKEPINFVLGVDLDWVCADFAAGLRPIAAEWMGVNMEELTPEPSFDFPEWGLEAAGGFEDLYRYAVTRRELFKNVPPVPGASLTLRRLWTAKRIRIRIITFRLYFEFVHEVAVSQTIGWLDRYDFPYWDLCFMKDKAAVGANLYIDDSISQVKALRQAGKKAILFITSQNRQAVIAPPRAENWKDVERLVLEEVELWEKERLAKGPLPIAGQ
jgi:5'(3')-deoxyribonucleotidase